VGLVKQAVRLPVIVNGDILTAQDAAEARRRSGADGVMVGRAAYGRPWATAHIAHYLITGSVLPEPALAAQRDIMLGHYADMLDHFGADAGMRGLPGSAEFRAAVMRLTSPDAVVELVHRFYDPLIANGVARSVAAPEHEPEPVEMAA
jgi:tRNA-dihydrouridine synthase B